MGAPHPELPTDGGLKTVRHGNLLLCFAPISHNRAKKGEAMLIFLILAAAIAAARAVQALRDTLAQLPRSNRDWIFY